MIFYVLCALNETKKLHLILTMVLLYSYYYYYFINTKLKSKKKSEDISLCPFCDNWQDQNTFINPNVLAMNLCDLAHRTGQGHSYEAKWLVWTLSTW